MQSIIKFNIVFLQVVSYMKQLLFIWFSPLDFTRGTEIIWKTNKNAINNRNILILSIFSLGLFLTQACFLVISQSLSIWGIPLWNIVEKSSFFRVLWPVLWLDNEELGCPPILSANMPDPHQTPIGHIYMPVGSNSPDMDWLTCFEHKSEILFIPTPLIE